MWNWLIKKLNGWDEEALTEDSELSIRIYQEGYKIKFIPYAITYEQEPESWRVWIKQRMRWVRGNNYVISKFAKQLTKFKNKRLAFDILIYFGSLLCFFCSYNYIRPVIYNRTFEFSKYFSPRSLYFCLDYGNGAFHI